MDIDVNAILPLLDIDTSLSLSVDIDVNAILPLLDINVSFYESTTMGINTILPIPVLSSVISIPLKIDVGISIPILIINTSIYPSVLIQATTVLPLPTIDLRMLEYLFITDAEGKRYISNSFALTMNTENGGLTEYYNYRFNSFALFNGYYLGANQDGIFILLGDRDDDTNIDTIVKTSLDDFGDSRQKRGDSVHVGVDTAEDMEVFVSNEEYLNYPCKLMASGSVGLETRKYKMAKGLRGRYWSITIKNTEGSDFILDQIDMLINSLSRKSP